MLATISRISANAVTRSQAGAGHGLSPAHQLWASERARDGPPEGGQRVHGAHAGTAHIDHPPRAQVRA